MKRLFPVGLAMALVLLFAVGITVTADEGEAEAEAAGENADEAKASSDTPPPDCDALIAEATKKMKKGKKTRGRGLRFKDKALEDALQQQTWDPSVKSLAVFPQVLTMMSEKIDWTQKLGDAFLAQQKDVMATAKPLRAKAQAQLSALRSAREELLERMKEIRVTLVRSCNDKGILYGSVTQRDIADGLQEQGYDVGTRSIRLANAIRRIGDYTVPIQFEKDLRTEIGVDIDPDQPLEEREEMEFDDEGNLIEKPKAAPKPPAAEGEDAAEAEAATATA